MTMFRASLQQGAVLAASIALSFFTTACLSAHDHQDLSLTPAQFSAGMRVVDGDEGRLRVRENRDNPDSALIEIAFVRFRHPAGAKATGAPIVFLPGGPGQPALGQIDQFADIYLNYVRSGGGGDMLLVEQRGIGQSSPRLLCPGELSRPIDRPLSAAIMGATHIEHIEACMAHWAAEGVDLSGYQVNSMADDVDELRQALGYDKIKLIGESFGTQHALALIQRHGEHIERAALTALIGPDDMFEKPAAVEAQLAKLGQLTEAKGDGAGDDPWTLARTALKQLDASPQTVTIETDDGSLSLEIGRYDLALATVELSRQTSSLKRLPALYQGVADGDLTWLAGWSASLRRGHQTNLASLAITCASGASDQRRAIISEQAANSLVGDAVDLLGADACTPLDDVDFGAGFQGPVEGDMPILMFSGELDSRTPPANAEALLAGFPNAQHLVFPNVSHDFGLAMQVKSSLAYRFLAGWDLPADILAKFN